MGCGGCKQSVQLKNKAAKVEKKQPTEHDAKSLSKIDETCVFCGEHDPTFTDDGLDLHFWKACPMLTRCEHCAQIIEIAGFTDHLVTECDKKDDFQKCPRCTEAIPKTEYTRHTKQRADNPAEPDKNHCPLCHQNISAGEEGWKKHLMGEEGCKENQRRVAMLFKRGFL